MMGLLRLLTVAVLALTTQGLANDTCGPVLAQDNETLVAASRFEDYFSAIQKHIIEGSYVIDAAELALLSEEHLLMLGPPGIAKTMFANLVLGNMVDSNQQPSYYKIQMTPETTMSETHGPFDYKVLTETGRYQRILSEGMLMHRNIFIDEFFDARSNALRNLLQALVDREHAQGPHITQGKIETVFATSNHYLSQVYEKTGNDGPKAVIDRFAFISFVPSEFEYANSYMQLIQSAKKNKTAIPPLSFDEVARLRALIPQVELSNHVSLFLSLLSYEMKRKTENIEQASLKQYREDLKAGEDPNPPYRSTKYHSKRTLQKAAGILKAIVVRDWIARKGQRELRATFEDIQRLKMFFCLGGPHHDFVQAQIKSATNPHERAQLETILNERKIFDETFDQILNKANEALVSYDLSSLQAKIDSLRSDEDTEQLKSELLRVYIDVAHRLPASLAQSATSPTHVAYSLVKEFCFSSLHEIGVSQQVKDWLASEDLEALKHSLPKPAAVAPKSPMVDKQLPISIVPENRVVLTGARWFSQNDVSALPSGNGVAYSRRNKIVRDDGKEAIRQAINTKTNLDISKIVAISDDAVFVQDSQGALSLLSFKEGADPVMPLITKTPPGIHPAALTEDGKTLWVLDGELTDLNAFNTSTGRLSKRVPITAPEPHLARLREAAKRLQSAEATYLDISTEEDIARLIVVHQTGTDYFKLDFVRGRVMEHIPHDRHPVPPETLVFGWKHTHVFTGRRPSNENNILEVRGYYTGMDTEDVWQVKIPYDTVSEGIVSGKHSLLLATSEGLYSVSLTQKIAEHTLVLAGDIRRVWELPNGRFACLEYAASQDGETSNWILHIFKACSSPQPSSASTTPVDTSVVSVESPNGGYYKLNFREGELSCYHPGPPIQNMSGSIKGDQRYRLDRLETHLSNIYLSPSDKFLFLVEKAPGEAHKNLYSISTFRFAMTFLKQFASENHVVGATDTGVYWTSVVTGTGRHMTLHELDMHTGQSKELKAIHIPNDGTIRGAALSPDRSKLIVVNDNRFGLIDLSTRPWRGYLSNWYVGEFKRLRFVDNDTIHYLEETTDHRWEEHTKQFSGAVVVVQ